MKLFVKSTIALAVAFFLMGSVDSFAQFPNGDYPVDNSTPVDVDITLSIFNPVTGVSSEEDITAPANSGELFNVGAGNVIEGASVNGTFIDVGQQATLPYESIIIIIIVQDCDIIIIVF